MTDFEQIESQNQTALIIASKNGHTRLAVFLIAYGASTKHQDDLGNTALHYAAAKEDLKLIQILI